jgi:hypothetical protein
MSKVINGNRREALRVLVGLLVCGAGALGIVHFMVRREPSADETVVLGPLSDFPVGEFQKRTITIIEHGTWLTGPAEKTVWLRRNADNSCLVLSGTCPHRNCMVNLENTTFQRSLDGYLSKVKIVVRVHLQVKPYLCCRGSTSSMGSHSRQPWPAQKWQSAR